jgi:hypothetical protein
LVSHIKERNRLKAFENRVLRRILGSKREEVTEEWRKLQNEELHNFSPYNIIIIMIRSRLLIQLWHVECVGEMRNTYEILVRILVGKRPLEIHRHIFNDNIKIDIKEVR